MVNYYLILIKILNKLNENNFKFQELVRIVDATLGNINEKGLNDGTNCLNVINFLANFKGMETFIGNEFKSFIDKEMDAAKNKENVREHVKKILMYPNFSYPPWVPVNVSDYLLDQMKEEIQGIKFQITLVNGKVYGLCISDTKLTDIVYDKLIEHNILDDSLEKNIETCHITLVNSNVVHDLGIDNIKEFISKYNDEFAVTTGKIKSTFSEDWSRFSDCYVIEIFCEYINNFLADFNSHFKKSIKMSPHITFAIKSRDLFGKMNK